MDDTIAKLEKVIPLKELQALQNIVIFREEDGTFNVYNKYLIKKNIDGIYVLSIIGSHTEKNFFKLKNAVSWCSYDKRNLIKEARRLHQLDQVIYGLETEIQIHTKLMRKTKEVDTKIICLSKLSEEKAKKRAFSYELDRYNSESEQWQNRMFDTKPKY